MGERNAVAKAICRSCAVRQDCLEEALANHERFGVWGGESERGRRRILRQRTGGRSRKPKPQAEARAQPH